MGVRGALALCIAMWALAIACPATSDATPESFFGVYSEEVFRDGPHDVLAQQAQVGAGVVRLPMRWDVIEPAPGQYDWWMWDDAVAAAARSGVQLLPTFARTPAFYSSRPPGSSSRGEWPPKDPDDMARFAAATAARYGHDGRFWLEHPELPYNPIRSWQIWNEPNVPYFWPAGPDPAAYTRLLAATAAGIRGADPRAEIVTAGIPSSRIGEPLWDFVDGMYAAGARPAFDVLAVHPYGPDPTAALEVLEGSRAVMDAHADASPIWATELGWASGGAPSPFTVDESRQAEHIWDVLHLLTSRRLDLGLRGVVVYTWHDLTQGTGGAEQWPQHAGLLRLDDSRKPAYAAFRNAVVDLAATAGSSSGADGVWAPTPADPARHLARSAIRLVGPRIVRADRHGRVLVRVRCLGAERCTGSLWIQRSGGKVAARRVVMGRRRFSTGPGVEARRRVRLRRHARRALARAGRLRVRVGAALPGIAPAGRRLVLLARR